MRKGAIQFHTASSKVNSTAQGRLWWRRWPIMEAYFAKKKQNFWVRTLISESQQPGINNELGMQMCIIVWFLLMKYQKDN